MTSPDSISRPRGVVTPLADVTSRGVNRPADTTGTRPSRIANELESAKPPSVDRVSKGLQESTDSVRNSNVHVGRADFLSAASQPGRLSSFQSFPDLRQSSDESTVATRYGRADAGDGTDQPNFNRSPNGAPGRGGGGSTPGENAQRRGPAGPRQDESDPGRPPLQRRNGQVIGRQRVSAGPRQDESDPGRPPLQRRNGQVIGRQRVPAGPRQDGSDPGRPPLQRRNGQVIGRQRVPAGPRQDDSDPGRPPLRRRDAVAIRREPVRENGRPQGAHNGGRAAPTRHQPDSAEVVAPLIAPTRRDGAAPPRFNRAASDVPPPPQVPLRRTSISESVRILAPGREGGQDYDNNGPFTQLLTQESGKIDLASLQQVADDLQGSFTELGISEQQQQEFASSVLNYLENTSATTADALYGQLVEDVGQLIESIVAASELAQTDADLNRAISAAEVLPKFSEALLSAKPFLIKEYNHYIARAGARIRPDPMKPSQKPIFDGFKEHIRLRTGIAPKAGKPPTKQQLEQIATVWVQELVPTIKDTNYANYGGARTDHFNDNDGEGSLGFILHNKLAVCRELSISASVLFSEYGVQSHVASGNVKQNDGDSTRGAHAWLEITDAAGDILLIVDSNNTKDHYDTFGEFDGAARGVVYRDTGARQEVVSIKSADLYADALSRTNAPSEYDV